MGGFGSGRRNRLDRRRTVEEYLALDVRTLTRNVAAVTAPRRFVWVNGAQYLGWANWQLLGDTVVIHTHASGPQALALTHTPCHYGGQRPWFLCPDPCCGRRVALLHLGSDGFRCRHCLGLSYQTRNVGRGDRLLLRARKLRIRLERSDHYRQFCLKPPGMHWRTFQQLQDEADHLETAGLGLAFACLDKIHLQRNRAAG